MHQANQTNQIDARIGWFATIMLEAQARTIECIRFVIEKTRLLDRLRGTINARQEKALVRIMAEGADSFVGDSAPAIIAASPTLRRRRRRRRAIWRNWSCLVRWSG
ncbi:hypothetical protein PX554_22150 [Sphingomonas sp. H39-1-10]|uniref:hypothetical protein n=1 Tax=Sphingomonas pollutisoli TaxID=3030829 RepID=UPI0023B8E33F|nr:hypothetical protein [Sphingomonas pollutisoli]MDF0490838.1 hypothetical protein [Sphingomonas pollutisoli]